MNVTDLQELAELYLDSLTDDAEYTVASYHLREFLIRAANGRLQRQRTARAIRWFEQTKVLTGELRT